MSMLVKPRLDKIVFIDPFQFLDTGQYSNYCYKCAIELLYNIYFEMRCASLSMYSFNYVSLYLDETER